MIVAQRVFVDSNVFLSRTIRDWLFFFRQETEGMFQIHTTEHVMAEVEANWIKQYPKAEGCRLKQLKEKVEACIDEIVDDFPGKVPFTGRDIGDYHVHAAAITCRADIILTNNNAQDFTANLDVEPYEIYTPDEFFTLIADSNPSAAFEVTCGQFEYWRKIRDSIPIDKALIKANCTKFAQIVRKNLQQIAAAQ